MALKGSYLYGPYSMVYRQSKKDVWYSLYHIESKLAPKSNVVFQNSDRLLSLYGYSYANALIFV